MQRSRRGRAAAIVAAACLWCLRAPVSGQDFSSGSVVVAPGVLTSFDDIWHLPETEQKQWHRVRIDYVVYYYDPLWQAMWGRCGEADSYLSLGNKVFPIKAGQRIRVEGFMQPAKGMRVEDAKVTVLAESAFVEVLPTKGEVGNSQRFNKRLVTMEGYVDRQVTRDANHLEVHLIAEGREALVQLLLPNDAAVPQLWDAVIRAKGVYFARSEDASSAAKIEIWVQRPEDIDRLGSLDQDERFNLPLTPLDRLASAQPESLIHVAGVMRAQQAGRSMRIADDTGELLVQTLQSQAVRTGERIEAIGFPVLEEGVWVLRQGLFRIERSLATAIAPLWELPEAEQRKWHRLRLEFQVYHYDPLWKGLWGRGGGSNDYLSLGEKEFPIKSGQRILIEGAVFPANGMTVVDPKVTLLEEARPIETIEVTTEIGNTDRFNKRFVAVEGLVDRQVLQDPRHVELDLVVEGRPVIGRVLLPPDMSPPNWENTWVRLKGVYNATQDPTGVLPTIEIWCIPENVAVLNTLDREPRFNLPLTAIEKLPALAPGALVHIAGAVRSQQPGKLLTLRDETGQIDLHTAQMRPVQLGESIEAIGRLAAEGGEFTLRTAIFRRSQAAPLPPTTALPKLRLADQLRELQPEEAARSYPVQLAGIVTWARPNADFFYVRDVSGGVCVFRPPDMKEPLYPGTKVEVTGVSASGRFTPVVLASGVVQTSSVELPEPRPVTLEQALTGVEEGQWITMSGYVRSVAPEDPWTRFEMTTSAGEFQVIIAPNERWTQLPGSVIRVRGVCRALANNKRQLTGIQVWVPSSRFVEIEEAVPADPFTVATRPIASLRQFGSLEALNRRVRVAGTVTHQSPGRLVHIQDGAEGLLVLSRDATPLVTGDRIEAVGFPGRENSRAVLREAVYRRVAGGVQPAPQAVLKLTPIDAELDGRLVRLEGLLLDIGTHERGVRLISQHEQVIFEALLDVPRGAVPESWVPGSQLALTGVYEIQFDEYRRPHAVRLQLRSPADVAVLRHPPWWTVKRVLALSGFLAVAVVLGFGWVIALRRRVHQQTGVIREQLESEKAARLDAALARASKLESLGVLAGGIAHDFNNLLTVIIGNVSLAKLDPHLEPDSMQCLTESERAAARARDLTQQLLTFAKGGAPVRMATRLPDVVREAAQFALHGSTVRCEFDMASDLWPAEVDKGQIGQVVHNIVINASQAMPGGGLIRIALVNDEVPAEGRPGLAAGRYVKVSFADSGTGISAENLTRIFEPYFTTKVHGSGLGLATVYSIVKKHQGHVEVESKVGEGTTFRIWVPAAVGVPESAAGPHPAAPKAGRVLLMDDEAPIRQLAGAVLKRMGVAVTAVNDGTAAINEYAAALAAGRRFDVVILDLTVPGAMGGAEAMRRLREMDPAVRAVVSSGYSSDPVMANYQTHGFCARIPKPYTATDLINVMKELLPAGS